MRMEKYLEFERAEPAVAEHVGALHKHLAKAKMTDDYQSHEVRNFEFSNTMYGVMFACYAIFFTTLMASLGKGTYAVFVIAVSIAFAIMYFGLMTILNHVNVTARSAIPDHEAHSGIQTYTGWLSNGAAYAQILTVPILFALFACVFAIIRASV